MIPPEHNNHILLILPQIPNRPPNGMSRRIRRDRNPMTQNHRLTIPHSRNPIKRPLHVPGRQILARLIVLGFDVCDCGAGGRGFEGGETAECSDGDGGVDLCVWMGEGDVWQGVDVLRRAVGEEDKVEVRGQVGRETRGRGVARIQKNGQRVECQQEAVVWQRRQWSHLQHSPLPLVVDSISYVRFFTEDLPARVLDQINPKISVR